MENTTNLKNNAKHRQIAQSFGRQARNLHEPEPAKMPGSTALSYAMIFDAITY